MTDQDLRQLEREASTGDEVAAGKLLVARVRAGQVQQEHVELAAHLGHPPAWCALGWELLDPNARIVAVDHDLPFKRAGFTGDYLVPQKLEPWAAGLVRWGREVCLRAGVAAARHKLAIWSPEFQPFQVFQPRGVRISNLEEVLSSVEKSVLETDVFEGAENPAPEGFRRRAMVGCMRAEQLATFWRETVGWRADEPVFLWHLARCASLPSITPQWISVTIEACAYRLAVDRSVGPLEGDRASFEARLARHVQAEAHVREVVRHELVAWALEGQDPVRDRVRAAGQVIAVPLPITLQDRPRKEQIHDEHSYVAGERNKPRQERLYDTEERP